MLSAGLTNSILSVPVLAPSTGNGGQLGTQLHRWSRQLGEASTGGTSDSRRPPSHGPLRLGTSRRSDRRSPRQRWQERPRCRRRGQAARRRRRDHRERGGAGVDGGLLSVPPAGSTAGTRDSGPGIAGNIEGGDAAGERGGMGPPEVAGEAGDEPGIGIAGSESRPLGGGIVLAVPGAGDMGRLAGGMNSAGLGGSMVRVGPVRGGTTGSAIGSERSDAVALAAGGCSSGQIRRTANIPAARLQPAARTMVSCWRDAPGHPAEEGLAAGHGRRIAGLVAGGALRLRLVGWLRRAGAGGFVWR